MSTSALQVAISVMPALMAGLVETLKISAAGIVVGSALGLLLGVIRGQQFRYASPAIGFYLHVLRGTPFLVQLYIAYFVLPSTGISWLKWDSTTAALVALSIYTSSYVTEIVSGGIRAVPAGQWEGAMACAMNRWQSLRYVILPQALKLILPSLAGVYVNLIKATSIVSVVGITELTRQGEISILRFPADVLLIYGIVAAIYFSYCFPALKAVEWLERRAARGS
ncbi:MAG: amino acid ABC transporter permease [Proteobacteria bacterium]|nr:amino acid ABC transporter permease [Pseudomonadota bacterium]